MLFHLNQKLFLSYILLFFFSYIFHSNYIVCKSNLIIDKLKSKVEISQINRTISALQLEANDPCEDKYFIQEINISNSTGYIMSIFDGHGGWILSQYANLLFYPYFFEELNSKNISDLEEEQKIIYSLKKTFARIEEEFKLISFSKNYEGNKKFKNLGTCALVALIINNKLYTANLGDSKAILLSKNNKEKNENYEFKKVSKIFNCRKKEEQKRLKEKWPNMKDIYKCKREKVCYVKGRLQPTSSLGDYYLKSPFYNIDSKKLFDDEYINNSLSKYEGPFIISDPDIKIFELTSKDKYLVMGSDGLWDYLNSKEIVQLTKNFLEKEYKYFEENNILENSDIIAFGLMEKVIDKSAKKYGSNSLDILDMKSGKKLRRIHDDITIIVCDLFKISK